MAENSTPALGKRYELVRPLGKGGMGTVFLALDRLTGKHVALKRVRLGVDAESASRSLPDSQSAPTEVNISSLSTGGAAAEGHATAPIETAMARQAITSYEQALRVALAQEFRVLASLRHPHIVSVLDYGFDAERQPYFTMEFLPAARDVATASKGLPLAEKVELLSQILHALTYLHRRGVLHRDLKPANILLLPTPDGARIKLLDFGLATPNRYQQRGAAEVSGTLGYIAPELLWGQAPTERADLYALGAVAFELLAELPAFRTQSETQLLMATLAENVQIASVDLPPPLTAVLRRLLAARPQDRFASAEETLRALVQAAELPLPVETTEIREPLLGAAALVGRETETAQLLAALKDAMAGRGQAVLLGGESGIGKSRLLEELRARAMVSGAKVLWVQCTSGGGADLGIFADALRLLCLDDPPEALAASVLTSLVPDLPALLGRPVPELPLVDAEAARLRLLTTVEAALLRPQLPLVLLIEDLHWARPDAIELLSRLSQRIAMKPRLLLCSYRTDERPGLPGELGVAPVLLLPRLGPRAIAQLSASILGEGQADGRLLDWLTAQTEGNTFFIVEVMRALAEEAGSLDAIRDGRLPQAVLTGGMRAVLRRRIDRIAAPAQALLTLIALAGRQVDLNLLRTLTDNAEEFLHHCAAAGVLEVHDQRWRFAHDKLREQLLSELTPTQRGELHRRIGTALEQVYPSLAAATAELAYHFEQGGLLTKAAGYAALAGEQALNRGALNEASALLTRACALQEQVALPVAERARTVRRLVDAKLGLGQMEEGVQALGRTFALLGSPIPDGKLAMGLSLLREGGAQLLHQLAPRWLRRPADDAKRRLYAEEAALHHIGVELNGHLGKLPEVAYGALRGINLARLQTDKEVHGNSQLVMSYLLQIAFMPSLSESYLESGRALLLNSPDLKNQLYALRVAGVIYHFRGEHKRAVKAWREAQSLAERLGDPATQIFLSISLAVALACVGEYQAAILECERCLAEARTQLNRLRECHALGILGGVYLRQGKLALAAEAIAASMAMAQPGASYFACGLRPMCTLRLGDAAAVPGQLEEALPFFEEAGATNSGPFEAAPAMLNAALTLRAQAGNAGERARAASLVRRSRKVLQKLALGIPLFRVSLLLVEGRAAWLAGHPRLARFLFAQCQALAERFGMGHDAALARCWLGRLQGGEIGARLRKEGLAQLREIGALWDVSQIESWPYAM
ncbi:MAG TPA: AAA family ATPase [Pseudomonadota bacterium]|nr:AAA family ATPase [Pseudomonadota bacterium]